MGTLLNVENLSVSLKAGNQERTVLSSVSLKVDEGEILGVVGEALSGKSLTASAIFRLLPGGARVLSGRIRYREQDLLSLEEAELYPLYQEKLQLIRPFTGAELVESINYYKVREHMADALTRKEKMSRSVLTSRAEYYLAKAGIPEPSDILERYPNSLPYAMRQQLYLAKALAGGAELVVLDDMDKCFKGFTEEEKQTFVSVLQRLRDYDGLSLLIFTRDFDIASSLCDRAMPIQEGYAFADSAIELSGYRL